MNKKELEILKKAISRQTEKLIKDPKEAKRVLKDIKKKCGC